MKTSKKFTFLALGLTCLCSMTAGIATSALSFAGESSEQAIACSTCGKGKGKLHLSKKDSDKKKKKKHLIENIA
jgi:hypothetical protein